MRTTRTVAYRTCVDALDAPPRYRPRWLVAYMALSALLWAGIITACTTVL